MSQVDPKQPVTTYGEFKREILNEIARCLSMPYMHRRNGAACATFRRKPEGEARARRVRQRVREIAVLKGMVRMHFSDGVHHTPLCVCDGCR